MSVAEIKKNVIEKINQIDDEITLRKIAQLVNNPKPRPSIEQIYQDIKAQYGNALQKLAE